MTSKDDWNYLTEQEDGELLALTLLEEIILKSQTVLFEKRIDVQVLPFALKYCKDTLGQLIDFKFYPKDHKVDQELWESDVEPETIPLDSWSRASIPIKRVANKLIKVSQITAEVDDIQPSVNKMTKKITIKEKPTAPTTPKKPTTYKSTRKLVSAVKEKIISEIQDPKGDIARSIQEENKRMLARIHNLQRDGSKADYTYDTMGRIILLASPGTIPFVSNVKAKFPTKSEKISKKIERKQIVEVLKKREPEEPAAEYISDANAGMPSFIETINPAPNVTVRENGNIRKGATKRKELPKKQTQNLKPLHEDIDEVVESRILV